MTSGTYVDTLEEMASIHCEELEFVSAVRERKFAQLPVYLYIGGQYQLVGTIDSDLRFHKLGERNNPMALAQMTAYFGLPSSPVALSWLFIGTVEGRMRSLCDILLSKTLAIY